MKKYFIIFFSIIAFALYAETPIVKYFDTIPEFCKTNYDSFLKKLDKEKTVKKSNATYSLPNLAGIKEAKLKDKNGEYTITYRSNSNTNRNEVVFAYFLNKDVDSRKVKKEEYNEALEIYNSLVTNLGQPKAIVDLGFLNYSETLKVHSLNAEWCIGDYRISFQYNCLAPSDTYCFLMGPIITVDDVNAKSDLKPLIKINLHQTSVYYYKSNETINEENDLPLVINLNDNSVYELSSLGLLSCKLTATDYNINLNFTTNTMIMIFDINRYTAKYTNSYYYTSDPNDIIARATGDVILVEDKPKF